MLDLVKLAGFGGRKPAQLSGGQRQRVALARALINHPKVLLLDEPLGALDLKLREQMQVELKGLQRRLGITFIFVTHDQGEALSMADRVAVFNAGRIAQVGAPEEIYERPQTRFVADFVGGSNVIEPDAAMRLGLAAGRLEPAAGEDHASPPVGFRACRASSRACNIRARSAAAPSSSARIGCRRVAVPMSAGLPAGSAVIARLIPPTPRSRWRARHEPRPRPAPRSRRPAAPPVRPLHAPAAAVPRPAARPAAGLARHRLSRLARGAAGAELLFDR